VADGAEVHHAGESRHRLRADDDAAERGLFGANLAAGYINDVNKASASNPGGYAPMLWFFGILSAIAFACMLALWVSGWRKPAAVAGA